MANRWFTQFWGSLEKKPVTLSCSFTVAATDTAGYGITGLVGPGISNVYMHTSATPAAGNPNPASGIILVQFQDNYPKYLFGNAQIESPVTGAAIHISTGSSLTVGAVYVITLLGTTTTAQWQAVGLPVGITPALGVSFVASATDGLGTGQVKAVGVSGISTVELMAEPNLTMTSFGPKILGNSGSGSYMLLQCLGATNSSTTTLIPTAPAAGSVIKLSFFLSNSYIKVQGQ